MTACSDQVNIGDFYYPGSHYLLTGLRRFLHHTQHPLIALDLMCLRPVHYL